MRWRGRRESERVEDRRGRRISRGGAGGLAILVIALVALFFGVDPTLLLQNIPTTEGPSFDAGEPGAYRPSPEEEELRSFVSVVLADTEDTWGELLAGLGGSYREPTLVLFSGAVQSACGFAQAAVGPFYCPSDEKIYIDLAFYDDLQRRFGAPGDFAQAYVIAHEVGHHVQTLLSVSEQVMDLRRGLNDEQANALSVRQELQADCFAGVWAYHANRSRHLLEEGDVEEGLNAAAAIGDDRLQRQAQGYVVPESFTHGSSAQRVRWFRKGLATGDPRTCDTFSVEVL